jgi:ribosome biogenesis GTPase
MELRDRGLDDWLADRTRYLVRDGEGEMPAELTGRLRFAAESSSELPGVGD